MKKRMAVYMEGLVLNKTWRTMRMKMMMTMISLRKMMESSTISSMRRESWLEKTCSSTSLASLVMRENSK